MFSKFYFRMIKLSLLASLAGGIGFYLLFPYPTKGMENTQHTQIIKTAMAFTVGGLVFAGGAGIAAIGSVLLPEDE